MEGCGINSIPQVGTFRLEGNSTTGSDRVKASMTSVSLKDSGEGQLHNPGCDGGIVEADPTTPTLVTTACSQKQSAITKMDEVFRRLKRHMKGFVHLILEKKNIHKELKDMSRNATRTLKQFEKVWRDARKLSTLPPKEDGVSRSSPIFRTEMVEAANKWERPPPLLAFVRKRSHKSDATKRLAPQKGPPLRQQKQAAPEWTTVRKKKSRTRGPPPRRMMPARQTEQPQSQNWGR
ncbi:hypothetical protein KM043_008068 [Ampulex compressa]|nr:hypothetical protein KM043_008068 [Ampulex compressa]